MFQHSMQNAYIGEVWIPGSNTVVYYNIDNSDTSTNIYDKSGNNHTLSGGTFTYTTDSYAGRVYSGGNYSTLPSTNIINFGQSFTFITWVKLTSTASMCSIFANGASASNHPSNAIQVSTVRTYGMASGILNSNLSVSSQANPSTGVWVCIAYTRDSSGNMVIYFNGVSVGTNTVSQSVTYPGNQFVLGGWRSGDKQPLNGYLKELIGETRARTADQILNYYNTFKANYGL